MLQTRRFSTALVRIAERWRRNIVRDVTEGVTPIEVVSKSHFKEWKSKQPTSIASWLKATGNTNPKPYTHIFLPVENTEDGVNPCVKILFIANDDRAVDGDDGGLLSPYAFSSLAAQLPTGKYKFEPPLPADIAARAELSWALGLYKYKVYNSKKFEKIIDEKRLPLGPVLVSPLVSHLNTEKKEDDSTAKTAVSDETMKLIKTVNEKLRIELGATATATYLVRDMINTPAEDCGPERIEEYVKAVVTDAKKWGGGTITFKRTVGAELLAHPGYPMVYAVGRAAPPERQPRMLELVWTPSNSADSKEANIEQLSDVVGNVAGSMTGTLVGVDGVGMVVGGVVSEMVSDIMHKMAEEGEIELKKNTEDKDEPGVLSDEQLKEITRRVALALEEKKMTGREGGLAEDSETSSLLDSEKRKALEEKMTSKRLPRVTLVGKGVTFDTGGLNLKPGDSMLTMKKDMGGAAQVLGLAHMIIRTGLKVRLRVLIPCAENSIGSKSFRPGDVLTARNGITVEIGNTDAEGRLLLADALIDADNAEHEKRDENESGASLGHLATDLADMLSDIMNKKHSTLGEKEDGDEELDEEGEDLIIDCATLTGAARVATGSEVGAVFSNRLSLAKEMQEISFRPEVRDLLWAQPLLKLYKSQLNSDIANLKNIGTGGLGGHITAALFLQEFLRKPTMIKNTKKFSEVETKFIEEKDLKDSVELVDVDVEDEEDVSVLEGEAKVDAATISETNGETKQIDEAVHDGKTPSEEEIHDDDENKKGSISEENFQGDMKHSADVAVTKEDKDDTIPDFIRRPPTPWIHVDMMAFNTQERPGRPRGGEAQGMRALYALLLDKYGKFESEETVTTTPQTFEK